MSEVTKIIVPPEKIDKDKLTEEEKTAILSREFRMEDHHTEYPMAKNGPPPELDDEDQQLLVPPRPEGTPEVMSTPLVRGKMLGEAQGMKPRLPLTSHAASVTDDASLDDVPPMKRAQVLAERAKAKAG